MLLVFDQIQVIRPKEVEDPDYDSANRAVFDLLPHTFGEIRKTHYEMSLDLRNRNLLLSTLDFIASQPKFVSRKGFSISFSKDGKVGVPGYTFLHVSKLHRFVEAELERRKLINPEAEDIVRGLHGPSDFRIVESNASNVILALIADHYARTSVLQTITDKPLGYLNVALNRKEPRRRNAVGMSLATAIIRFQIPQTIGQLTPKQYVSLRQRYDDLRMPFQHAVRTICDDNLLAGIENRRQFEQAVHEAAREFSIGVDRLMKSKFAKKLGKWGPLSFGICSSLCKLGSPVTALLGVGVDCSVKLYSGLVQRTPATEIRQAQKLMATLRRELISPILMRRLL